MFGSVGVGGVWGVASHGRWEASIEVRVGMFVVGFMEVVLGECVLIGWKFLVWCLFPYRGYCFLVFG